MQNFFEILPQDCDTAVALGYFDGIHRGHRSVLSLAVREKQRGLSPVCFTFAQSPKSVLSRTKETALMTANDKIKTLEALGIETTYQADFLSIMDMSEDEFVREILIGRLKAKRLFCGFNYHFGKNGSGNSESLKRLCKSYGAEVTVVPPEIQGDTVISSSLIRELIADGEIRQANDMLCSRFGFSSVIEHGKRLGRELGTPTINQPLVKSLVVPKFGVYASAVTLENGKVYCGVSNIGIKPTVGGTAALCETWMPDYRGKEIYGQCADIRLIDFIRPERKFSGIDELKRAIVDNAVTARKIFDREEIC